MNGYEKNSEDYGGPPAGWGTWLMLAAMIGSVSGVLLLELWRFVSS